jgi:SAM-dependent methyltransferase
MRTLDKIAIDKGTDKSSQIHNYCVKYEKWLPFNRLEPITILEIGVLSGESLETWREYYPNAKIVGIDIMPECKKYEDLNRNIFVEIGSQDDPNFLEQVANKHGAFDLIVDDGSHINQHVITSFIHLISSVKPEGVYVIEDCGTSYWEEWGGGFRQQNTSVEFSKRLVDDVNFNGQMQEDFWNVHARREDHLINQTVNRGLAIRTDIESVNFLNGIIIITKR